MMMRLTADDVEPQSLPAGTVPRRGTMALSAADTCKRGVAWQATVASVERSDNGDRCPQILDLFRF